MFSHSPMPSNSQRGEVAYPAVAKSRGKSVPQHIGHIGRRHDTANARFLGKDKGHFARGKQRESQRVEQRKNFKMFHQIVYGSAQRTPG